VIITAREYIASFFYRYTVVHFFRFLFFAAKRPLENYRRYAQREQHRPVSNTGRRVQNYEKRGKRLSPAEKGEF
jgi:hypothetical protein